jgi:hypothetical protein
MIECAVKGPEISSPIGPVCGIWNLRGSRVEPLIAPGIVPGEHPVMGQHFLSPARSLPPLRADLAA